MKKSRYEKGYVPKFAYILFFLAAASALVSFVAKRNEAFCEWIVSSAGYYVRLGLGIVSSLVPFSIAEILIAFSPVLLIAIIVSASKRDGRRSKIRFLSGLLALISLFYSGYVFTLGVGYHREPVANRLGISEAEVNRESLLKTLLLLRDEVDNLLPEIEFSESGSSVSPIDFEETSKKIVSAYDTLDSDFSNLNIKNFYSSAKPVRLSRAMTALDLLGVYTFFTGESNVNVHYPDYNTPCTIAHELAHQRGISREDEANFIAFLVCIRSDDAYVRYSGYMNMLEYVASALARTDRELYRETLLGFDERIIGEMNAQSVFYNENKNELLGKISEFVNDKYLKAQGTEGVVSYGLTVRLTVAYYDSE